MLRSRTVQQKNRLRVGLCSPVHSLICRRYYIIAHAQCGSIVAAATSTMKFISNRLLSSAAFGLSTAISVTTRQGIIPTKPTSRGQVEDKFAICREQVRDLLAPVDCKKNFVIP